MIIWVQSTLNFFSSLTIMLCSPGHLFFIYDLCSCESRAKNFWKAHTLFSSKCFLVFLADICCLYGPPTKLPEGHVFTGVCLFGVGISVPRSLWGIGRYLWYQVPSRGLGISSSRTLLGGKYLWYIWRGRYTHAYVFKEFQAQLV